MILIYAVAHGQINHCNNIIAEAMDSGSFPRTFLSDIEKRFRPFKYFGGENWTTPGATNALQHFPPPSVVKSHGTHFSPNFLSMLVQHSIGPHFSITSPLVNHRALHIDRVWPQHATIAKINPGIIGTLLGLSTSSLEVDESLSKLDYFIIPYKLCDGVDVLPNTFSINSEFIFAHLKDVLPNQHATHIHPQDVVNLIQLLAKVCYFSFPLLSLILPLTTFLSGCNPQ